MTTTTARVYSVVLTMFSHRQSDPKQAFYAQEAREFLRKKLIGKHVKISIDFLRPREGDFDERECATIRYGGHNACVNLRFFLYFELIRISNVAEQLIEKGLASVVRHKRDDEDRSPDFDKFMAAEQTCVLRFILIIPSAENMF